MQTYFKDPQVVAILEAHAKEVNYQDKEVIIKSGDNIKVIPIILEGVVKVLAESQEGGKHCLFFLRTGETCAFQMYQGRELARSKISAQAEGAVKILAIPIDQVAQLQPFSEWNEFYVQSINQKLDSALQAFEYVAFNNLEGRLVQYLKDRMQAVGSNLLQATHYEIADDLHTSREVVSRQLKLLEQEGKVRLDRSHIEWLRALKSD